MEESCGHHLAQPSVKSRLSEAWSSQVLNISSKGNSTIILGNLFQYLIILTVNICSCIQIELLKQRVPVVSCSVTMFRVKRVIPSSLQLCFTYWRTVIASHLSLLFVRPSKPNSFSFLQYVFQPSHHLGVPLLDCVQIFSVSLELAQSPSQSVSLHNDTSFGCIYLSSRFRVICRLGEDALSHPSSRSF